jgi:transposase
MKNKQYLDSQYVQFISLFLEQGLRASMPLKKRRLPSVTMILNISFIICMRTMVCIIRSQAIFKANITGVRNWNKLLKQLIYWKLTIKCQTLTLKINYGNKLTAFLTALVWKACDGAAWIIFLEGRPTIVTSNYRVIVHLRACVRLFSERAMKAFNSKYLCGSRNNCFRTFHFVTKLARWVS